MFYLRNRSAAGQFATSIGLLTVLTVLAMPASAQVVNGSFESATAFQGWTTSGDNGIIPAAFGKTIPNGSKQAFLFAGTTVFTTTPGNSPGQGASFNTSSPQVTATSLATFLGTTTTALNTAAGGSFTANAGSGIKQTFNVNAGDTISFTWDFLTEENRDDPTLGLANDFSFFVLNGSAAVSGITFGDPNLLGRVSTANYSIPFPSNAPASSSQDGSVVGDYYYETADGSTSPLGSSTAYNGASLFKTLSFTVTTAGSLTLGFGVVNVGRPAGTSSPANAGSTDIPSTLLLDNVVLAAAPPAGAAPEPGALALAGAALAPGLLLLRRRRRESRGA